MARELERRWNEKLRLVADLEVEYRQEQERGLSPLTEAEKTELRALVSHAPALWHAPDTTMAERKRLLRCLISEVIVQRDEAAKNAGGQTTVRIGWRSGAWTALRVRRPSSTDALRTPQMVLDRIRTLAAQEPDARIAQILTTEGLQTRWGLPWTALRVQRVRAARSCRRDPLPGATACCRWPRPPRRWGSCQRRGPIGGGGAFWPVRSNGTVASVKVAMSGRGRS